MITGFADAYWSFVWTPHLADVATCGHTHALAAAQSAKIQFGLSGCSAYVTLAPRTNYSVLPTWNATSGTTFQHCTLGFTESSLKWLGFSWPVPAPGSSSALRSVAGLLPLSALETFVKLVYSRCQGIISQDRRPRPRMRPGGHAAALPGSTSGIVTGCMYWVCTGTYSVHTML